MHELFNAISYLYYNYIIDKSLQLFPCNSYGSKIQLKLCTDVWQQGIFEMFYAGLLSKSMHKLLQYPMVVIATEQIRKIFTQKQLPHLSLTPAVPDHARGEEPNASQPHFFLNIVRLLDLTIVLTENSQCPAELGNWSLSLCFLLCNPNLCQREQPSYGRLKQVISRADAGQIHRGRRPLGWPNCC